MPRCGRVLQMHRRAKVSMLESIVFQADVSSLLFQVGLDHTARHSPVFHKTCVSFVELGTHPAQGQHDFAGMV